MLSTQQSTADGARQVETLAAAASPTSFVREQLAELYASATTGSEAEKLKAGDKVQAELVKLFNTLDDLPFSQNTLLFARGLAPLCHGVAVASAKKDKTVPASNNAEDLVKVAFKSLFRGEAPLSLDALQAQQFLEFVLEVIVASQKGTLQHLALGIASADDVANLGPYLNVITGAMNTHDGKSAHSSAQLEVAFPHIPQASRFLNSSALAPVFSARASGGPLRDVSWLERVNCCRIQVEGKTFSVLEALCQPEIREHLRQHGVTAFDGLPYAVPTSTDGYSGQFIGQTRVKVSAERSIALNLLPANAMLKATSQLGARVAELSNQRMAALYREHLLPAIAQAHRDVVAQEFPVEKFIEAAEFEPNGKKLLTAVNKVLKKLKAAELPDNHFRSIWRTQAPYQFRHGRNLERVPVVSSQPQNCGGAYCSFAKSQGPFRFPAAPNLQERRAPREERLFHAAEDLLRDAMAKAVESQHEYKSLEEKYQLGDK